MIYSESFFILYQHYFSVPLDVSFQIITLRMELLKRHLDRNLKDGPTVRIILIKKASNPLNNYIC